MNIRQRYAVRQVRTELMLDSHQLDINAYRITDADGKQLQAWPVDPKLCGSASC